MAAEWPAPVERAPAHFTLSQNYPNPFNPTTTIQYEIPWPGSRVEIRIYDVVGRLVAALVDEHKLPGMYILSWNGRDRNGESVTTGVYFLRMRANQFVDTKKLLLLK
jgi:flagellar hook assembly protein FlgD